MPTAALNPSPTLMVVLRLLLSLFEGVVGGDPDEVIDDVGGVDDVESCWDDLEIERLGDIERLDSVDSREDVEVMGMKRLDNFMGTGVIILDDVEKLDEDTSASVAISL